MSIVCGPATVQAVKTSSALAMTGAEVHDSQSHNNKPVYANRAQRQHQQQRNSYGSSNQNDVSSAASTAVKISATAAKRNYASGINDITSGIGSSGSGSGSSSSSNSHTTYGRSLMKAFNGLTSLSGLQHISNGYGTVNDDAALSGVVGSKQEIPIYEEQQENDYDATASTSGVTGYAGENNQHTNSGASGAFSNAIYNLHAADTTHNSFLPMLDWHGKTALSTATLSTAATSASPYTVAYPTSSTSSATLHQHQHTQHQQQQQQQQPQLLQSSDKISDGNFLQHYEHNSGYNELSAATAFEQRYHPQQQHQQHQQQQQYFSPSADSFSPHSAFSYASSAADASEQNFYEHQQLPPQSLPPTGSATAHGDDGYDDATNYLSISHATNTHSQPDVINYVPYPVVKKLHVPVHQPVKIPVSHAVILPISKPVPIQIPVAQQIQVPVEKELKIPVERVVPIPVEKHIPVPVEKRVPYPVVKYVPIKVPRPFPVKVPVFKTVLHKVKGSWW